jgi:alkaline phosphatase
VLVAAMGPGAWRVKGYMPNTQIFHILMAAYGWKESGK